MSVPGEKKIIKSHIQKVQHSSISGQDEVIGTGLNSLI